MIFEQYFPLVVDQLVKIWKLKKISWDSYVFEGQVLTISTNIGQQMYVLNEKVRAVLSLAFQNFHTIFEELNNVYNHFQVNSKIEFSDELNLFIFWKNELDHELKTLIELLTREIKKDREGNQGKLINIEQETLIQMKTCFQEMVCQLFLRELSNYDLGFLDSLIQSINSNIMDWFIFVFNTTFQPNGKYLHHSNKLTFASSF